LFDKIIWKKADILDIPSLEVAFQNIEFVYHCAAMVSFDPNDEDQMRKINIEGTANVVNCCLAFDVKKLCHVSSIAALGDLAPHETVVDEESEWNPEMEHSDYAISKFGSEMEVWRGQQEGLKVVVVNPGVILGITIFGSWHVGSGKVFETVADGLKFYTNGMTGFVAVNDVVKAMKLLMESEISSQKFILVSENWTYQHLTKTIAKKLNIAPPKFGVEKWQTNIFWRIDWLISKMLFKNRILSKAMSSSLHSKDFYDNSKIKKAIGFEFEPLEKTIGETAVFYLNQHSYCF
jgi:nucleoside-diphosphate-sugar epimerase